MAATSDQEKIGGQMLDRARLDGLFIPNVYDLDKEVRDGFQEKWPVQGGKGAAASSTIQAGSAYSAASRLTANLVYQDYEVTPRRYMDQVRIRTDIASGVFAKMLAETDGIVDRRVMAYFLGLGLNDALDRENDDNKGMTVLALLCKNANVSAATVRLALAFLQPKPDLNVTSEKSEYFTPLGLAIISAVRMQETDTKTQSFGDNAVEKVRVLLEHGASLCQVSEEGRDPIRMEGFLDMLEAGHARIEALDLVALGQLRNVLSAHNLAEKNKVEIAEESNPVLVAFDKYVAAGQLEGFLQDLKNNQHWDAYVDRIEHEYHLPLLWSLIKRYYSYAESEGNQILSAEFKQKAKFITPLFDMLMHWYLDRKKGSTAFKFDSLACIFWFCVGAWRRFGASLYDANLASSRNPFPLLTPEDEEGDVAYMTETDEGQVRTVRSMGTFFVDKSLLSRDKTWSAIVDELRKVPQALDEDFKAGVMRAYNLAQQIRPASGTKLGQFYPDKAQTAWNIPEGKTYYPTERAFAGYLAKTLTGTPPAGTPYHALFMIVTKTVLQDTRHVYKLFDALMKWDKLAKKMTDGSAALVYKSTFFTQRGTGPDDKVFAEEKTTGTNPVETLFLINKQLGTYQASANLTLLQYPVLLRLLHVCHEKIVKTVSDLSAAALIAHSAASDTHKERGLKKMYADAEELTKVVRMATIVSGAMALTLGMDSDQTKLYFGDGPARASKEYAIMNQTAVYTAVSAIAAALEERGIETKSLEGLRDAAAVGPATGLIGATFDNVIFGMPISLQKVAPVVEIEHFAQLFPAIGTYSTAFELHETDIFAKPETYSVRVDTSDKNRIWPQIPGALL